MRVCLAVICPLAYWQNDRDCVVKIHVLYFVPLNNVLSSFYLFESSFRTLAVILVSDFCFCPDELRLPHVSFDQW